MDQKAAPAPRDLLFLNPALRSGLNLTVRLGDKWMDAQPGELLAVKKTGDDGLIGHVIVAEAVTAPFGDIPADWLQFEHDEGCRNFEGLAAAMKAAYGREIAPEERITLLFFTLPVSAV